MRRAREPRRLSAALQYTHDCLPGIRRRPTRAGFAYYDASNKRIVDTHILQRIRALAIPPAYEQVWICGDPSGHLQATGRDSRGRKQYRYHVQWRVIRDAKKFARLKAFGAALPKIRAKVGRDLARPALSRDKILATVLRLLETTLIRIGNEEYATANNTYGLTTLRQRHVRDAGKGIRFEFRSKSGIRRAVKIADPRLTRIIRRCMELPGKELFHYLDEEGKPHAVSSGDVNAYLQEIIGADFTAKDYRTWAASVLALSLMRRALDGGLDISSSHTAMDVVREVAAKLGNTPAVCRKAYIHPGILLLDAVPLRKQSRATRPRKHLHADELDLLDFLNRPAAMLTGSGALGAGKKQPRTKPKP